MDNLRRSLNNILKEVEGNDEADEQVDCFCNKFESPRSRRSREKTLGPVHFRDKMLKDEGVKEEIDQEDLNDSILDPNQHGKVNDIFGRLKPNRARQSMAKCDSEEEHKYEDQEVDLMNESDSSSRFLSNSLRREIR